MNADYLRQFDYGNPPEIAMERRKTVETSYKNFRKTAGYKAFIADIKQQLETEPYVWVSNRFPYNVERPIQHSCLWYKGSLTKRKIKNILKSMDMDYITFFENLDDFKSIKDVSHYHIFHY